MADTWEIITNLARLPSSFSSRTSWMPSRPGISRSTSTRSGSSAMIRSGSGAPSSLAPHTRPSALLSRISSSTPITEGSSSAI